MSNMPTVRPTHHVPARAGTGFDVRTGDLIRITDLQGSQPVDIWAFCKEDHLEFLSCEHTKPSIGKPIPQPGEKSGLTRAAANSTCPALGFLVEFKTRSRSTVLERSDG